MIFDHAPVRRSLSVAALLTAALAVAGCTDTSRMNADVFRYETAPVFFQSADTAQPPARRTTLYTTSFHQTYGLPVSNPVHLASYAATEDDGRMLPAIPYRSIDPRYLRQEVEYQTVEKPGTIVVDTKQRFLYLVQPGGKAMRYGVGIGRDGYAWSGRGVIQWKQKWPRWTPPDDMVERQPDLKMFAAANGGMNPGLNNPLGARALYIFKDGKDTLYRIHGTPDWKSVGKATSSGCVRMLNQDVIDLFERVSGKSQIVVL
ncbi:MAG: hypothetical protein BGN83_13260 [Rhizobium sp. 63-7]|nr:MAG: hypothetical protein BGN83_13260 [Rhizobium sp. 63-7]